MTAASGGPVRAGVAVSALTVTARLVPAADATTVRLRLPAGRHRVIFPRAAAPVAYAVARDGAPLRLAGPAYGAGTGRRRLDTVAGDRRVRRVRRRLGR
ncbi:hypothetical protein GCM10010129_35130 [Streptomyces fumigatiscleroticus]|nr:hypothetical protein GCM10010129_35130 [Streptomyces fumigatiscleroticus]